MSRHVRCELIGGPADGLVLYFASPQNLDLTPLAIEITTHGNNIAVYEFRDANEERTAFDYSTRRDA